MGEQEALKRQVLTADKVSQDKEGLKQLIVSIELDITKDRYLLINCSVNSYMSDLYSKQQFGHAHHSEASFYKAQYVPNSDLTLEALQFVCYINGILEKKFKEKTHLGSLLLVRGAMVEWLEQLVCGAESSHKVVSSRLGLVIQQMENFLCQPSSKWVPFSN